MIRRIFGVLLALIGLIVAVVGVAAAFWLIGPDNTVQSGEQQLSSKGLAIASTPDLLNRHGPVLHVDVRSTKNQPVFVGVARDFDVSSYLKDIAHTKLVQVQYPIALSTQDQKGTAGPLAAPDTLDWWVAKANGTGTQSIAWPIEDGPYDVVIMSADGKTAPDVQVDLGIEIPKAFIMSLVILAAGIILLAVGILLVLFRRRSRLEPPQNTSYFPPDGTPAPSQHQPGPPQQSGAQTGGGAVRRVLTVGLAFGLVTGCTAIPQPDTVKALTRPAIGDAAAVAVIKHYNVVNNKANSTRNRNLIATIEGGDLVRESQAGYTIDQAAKAKPDAAFTYTNSVIGAPQFGGYPMRFVSSSGISDNKAYRHLGVWERVSAGSPWMLRFAAGVKTTVKLPDLIGLRPAGKADNTKLAAAPQAAATALATYLTAGAKSPKAAVFVPNTDITGLIADLAKTRAGQASTPKAVRSVTDVFTAPQGAPTFMTKAGTAIMFVTLTHEHTLLVANNYNFSWAAPPMTAFSPATAKYESALTSTTLHDVVLLIPPKGKIQVASLDSQLVDAGGY
ncbi:hypothetical protein [Kribbella sp. VKM Ac-2569]|uniref:hypothetical protein n=1 Tax=Kribbella sp. VKM Ac-2569 TaxID=2512220 RepID=UPI00102B78F9|nr:hypothetical protein [Kribbella sp. VKM Ac-2569]